MTTKAVEQQALFKQGQRRGRITLLSLVFVFALPALLAKLFLSQNWYNAGATNHGVLFDDSVHVSTLGIDNRVLQTPEPSWTLSYVLPEICSEQCVAQMELLESSHIALGQYQSRVRLVALDSGSRSLSQHHRDVSQQLNYQKIPMAADKARSYIAPMDAVIIDPLGQVVMKFSFVSTEKSHDATSYGSEQKPINGGEVSYQEQNSVIAKGLLSDLRKLIKLSRVG